MSESAAARVQRHRAIRICLRASGTAADPSYARWTLRMARRLANKHARTAVATGSGAAIIIRKQPSSGVSRRT